MSDDVYTKVREQLDQYSVGFPSTESGVELEILKKMFTPAGYLRRFRGTRGTESWCGSSRSRRRQRSP